VKPEVLFIGNSLDVKSSIERLAYEAGLRCKCKKDIRSGLNASRDGQIVVVDCDLPDGTIEECIEALNKLNNHIITMALVSVPDLESFRRLVNTGAWFCVPKPIDIKTLSRIFTRALSILNQMTNKAEDNIEEFLSSKLEFCLQRSEGNRGFSLYDTVLSEVEKALLSLALKKTKGNKAKAARILGVNRNTLTKKVKYYGL